jgi:hypothetical protein
MHRLLERGIEHDRSTGNEVNGRGGDATILLTMASRHPNDWILYALLLAAVGALVVAAFGPVWRALR